MMKKDFFMKVALILVLPFFALQSLFAQHNLLLNGSFEELVFADLKPTVIDGQIVRFNKSRDTSLFWVFGKQKKRAFQVNSKYWNFVIDTFSVSGFTYYSNTGNAYAGKVFGMITPFWQASNNTYFVFNLVGQMCTPLKKGHVYELSFWIKPYVGNYFLDKIEVHFTGEIINHRGYIFFEKIRRKKDKVLFPLTNMKAHCTIKLDTKDTENYKQVKCRYTASGGETYLYIGIMESYYPRKFKRKKLKLYGALSKRFSVPVCKYLIDEVKLISISDKREACISDIDTATVRIEIPEETDDSVLPAVNVDEEDDLIIVFFETNAYLLIEEEKLRLVNRLQELNADEITEIHVSGHTDATGTEKINAKLSLDRAMEVEKIIKQILFKKLDVLPAIFTVGKSSTIPIVLGQNDLSRSKNRRVEIKIKRSAQ